MKLSLCGLKIMIRMIIEYQDWLDVQEKISLVFLLCDDASTAQCILTKNIVSQTQPNQILPDLLEYFVESREQDIENKIIESLILIKNYKLVRLLGFNETDKQEEMNKKTERINTVRKVLLRICESMSDEDLVQLIDLIKEDFNKHKSYFINYGSNRMEINLLFYICQGYITDGTKSKSDVSNLVRVLKKMNLHSLADELLATERKASEECLVTLCKDNDCMQSVVDLGNIETAVNRSDECYAMDEDNMGLCLIVNQRNFPKERLCRNNVFFDSIRHGTNRDRDMLKMTFIGLGYEVVVFENQDNVEMEKSIRGIIKEKIVSSHSSLVLCILSHGKRGTVYCVDGVGVEVEDIQKWILGEECPQLLMRPKVLLIQACQGNDFQKAQQCMPNERDSAMLECDGPSERHVPPTADLLTFWATVPGYASCRHTSLGSIFIQTLCFELLKHGHVDHFGDIATYVNKQLSEKHIGDDHKVSMSQVTHTLRKKLYFPSCQQHRLEAAKLLFKNYFFDVLIKECILKFAALKFYNSQRQHPSV